MGRLRAGCRGRCVLLGLPGARYHLSSPARSRQPGSGARPGQPARALFRRSDPDGTGCCPAGHARPSAGGGGESLLDRERRGHRRGPGSLAGRADAAVAGVLGRCCRNDRLGVPADLSATSDVYRSASLSNAGDHDNLLAHPEYLVLGPEGLAEGRTYVAEEEGSLLAGRKNGGSPGSARTRTPAATGRSSAPSPTLTWPPRRRFE
jgi:hypothetical protein